MKRQLIYLILVALAAILVFAFENPFASRLANKNSQKLFEKFDTADVQRIEISQMIDGALLTKVDGKWFAEDLTTDLKKKLYAQEEKEPPVTEKIPADEEKIKSGLGVVFNLEKGTLTAKSKDKHDMLQVGSAGVLIAGFDKDGKKLFGLIVGKSGPDLISTYVRNDNSDNVYLIETPLVGAFSTRSSDWKDPKSSSAAEPAEKIESESEQE